jgi:hypothetical protein
MEAGGNLPREARLFAGASEEGAAMERMTRRFGSGSFSTHTLPLFLVLAVAGAAAAFPAASAAAKTARQTADSPDEITQAASPGGAIRMHLSAGSYTIRGSAENKIHVHWSTRNPADMRRVSVQVDVQGKEATIRTHGPHNNFQVEIEVPSVSHLRVRLSAGEMRISGIEGNKDVELHAGDLAIDIGRAEDYGNVDASVQAGDIDAAPFHQSKGGLWRSFHWRGTGKYRLHAHVGAGDLTLTSGTVAPREPQE